MAKNRNKKKKSDVASMDLSETTVSDVPEAMDTSESGVQKPSASALNRVLNKGRPMKRSKNVRKTKAMAKAISLTEKYAEKSSKNENKTLRTQSAKKLYD